MRIPTYFGHQPDVKPDTVPIQTGHLSDSDRTMLRPKSDSFEGAIGMVSGLLRAAVRHVPEQPV